MLWTGSDAFAGYMTSECHPLVGKARSVHGSVVAEVSENCHVATGKILRKQKFIEFEFIRR